MVALTHEILERLELLPEREQQEVLDFVEFLTTRIAAEQEPLLAVAGILREQPLSAEQIERELYGTFKLGSGEQLSMPLCSASNGR